MPVENQVMRLPRYARGLRLVRYGMFLMLLQFLLSAYVVTLSLRGSDEHELFRWMEYTLWANIAAVGVMLLGALLSIPELVAAKLPRIRLIVSVIGLGIALASIGWSLHLLRSFIAVFESPDAELGDLLRAADRFDAVRTMTILRDLSYPVGVIGILSSIRQTAVANEHYALRDAAGGVTNLMVGLAVFDVLYQVTIGQGLVIGLIMAILALVAGLVLVGFWVYCHLRVAKFLKAASILVHEPHHLPVARVLSRSSPIVQPDAVPEPARPSAPAPAPKPVVATDAARPSQPLVVVPAELRPVVTPRAETAPGAPADEPKLLR